MNRKTLEVFYALMKKGVIDRQNNSIVWGYSQEAEVAEELEEFKDIFGFDIYRTKGRLYLIPTQENELFLKNTSDFRKEISVNSDCKNYDLYLMSYLAIYLIYIFFNGEGADTRSGRDFISKQGIISEFTKHCKTFGQNADKKENDINEYSDNFKKLGEYWLSKIEGEPNDRKFASRYGILNKILTKFKADDIFVVSENNTIRPSQKLTDLMPYFLSKRRISEINMILGKGENYAAIK